MKRRCYLILLWLAVLVAGTGVVLVVRLPPAAGAHLLVPRVEPRWGPDFRANPSPTKTTDKHKNISMAVDPTNPNKVLAGYDYRDSGGLGSGYSWSTDGGRTWLGGYFERPQPGGASLLPFGNASVAFDASGTAYYVTQA